MNKRILISNNDSEEIEILVESLFNKAAQVPNRRLLVIVTDTDYYEELIEAIKSKIETSLNTRFKILSATKTIVELFTLSTIEIMLKKHIWSIEGTRGKKIDDLYIKANQITVDILTNNRDILYSLLSCTIATIDPTFTLLINNNINVSNELIADYRKILL